jgi:type III secretory pathway lipoprotein EscJ
MGKGHYYKNQNVEKQPKRTSKISVFLVHHYYKNQNVEKNEKNIKSLIFVWFYILTTYGVWVLWTTGVKK